MRRVLWYVGVLAVLWCVWWAAASAILQGSVTRWFDDRRDEGWLADTSVTGGGFPLTLIARLDDLALADPGTGVALSAPWLSFSADAWWPGNMRLTLPPALELRTPERRAELIMTDGVMRLDLAPERRLGLRAVAWTAGPWGVSRPRGTVVSAESLTLAMHQQDDPGTYLFDIRAEATAPGVLLRDALAIPDDWPLAFDALEVDMTVQFDRRWDLRAIEQRRPQPRRIDLRLAEAAWAGMRLRVAAGLDVDPDGIAQGEIRVQAENWGDMLDLAERAGVLPERFRAQADRLLETLAGSSGNPNTIDVTLRAVNGRLMLGFLPVGPAPKIVLP